MSLQLASASPFCAVGPLDILVVDDEEDIRTLVGMALRGAQHRVSFAASGAEAVRCLRSRPVDVVVTDILMPDGDGLEVIAAARRAPGSPRIIAMSGGGKYMSGPDCLRVARGLGADEALQKPFNCAQLLEVVSGLGRGTPASF